MDLFTKSMQLVLQGLKLSFLYFFFRRKSRREDGANFMDDREKEKLLSSTNKGLLIDGDSGHLSEEESFQNVCIVAKPGVGKTTKYIIPNVLDRASRNCSMVINDPKGEVRDLTSGHLKSKGFNVVTFDVSCIHESQFFNPCTEAKGFQGLDELAETLIWSGNPGDSDPYWNNSATRIVAVILKCLSLSDPDKFNLPELYRLMQRFGDHGKGLEEWIFEHCDTPEAPERGVLFPEWLGALTGSPNTVNTSAAIAMTALKKIGTPDLQKFFSRSEYDFSRLRKEKTVIYLITPPGKQEFYGFVTSLLFKTVFNECMTREHLRNKKNSLPVYCMFDEFGNSYLPDMVSIANTARGYRVSLSIILQSFSQLAIRYGENGSNAIQGAMNTNMCYAGGDLITCHKFSEMAGRVRDKKYRDFIKDDYDIREMNLMNPDAIRTMESDEALLICKNKSPVKIKVKPYHGVFKWKRASKKPPYIVERPFDRNGTYST